MTVPQAGISPVLNTLNGNTSLETITLKNIVALDLIQHNEAVLKACTLLDDTETVVSLPNTLTREKLEHLIETRKEEVSQLEEQIKTMKHNHSKPHDEVLDKLCQEFLQSEVPMDDVDDLLHKFEKDEGVRVVIDYDDLRFTVVQ